MSDLAKLIQFLSEKLRDHDPSPPNISQWLARIGAHERCIQLAACMGMDLLKSSISVPLVAGLVSRAEALAVDYAALTASELFQISLSEHPQEELLCAYTMPDGSGYAGEYVRVLDFLDFLDFYAPYKATSAAKLEQARRRYPNGTPLGFVRSTWRGRLPVVWVTTNEQLRAVLEPEEGDPPATRVARRFGLGNPMNTLGLEPEYVAIKYPPNAPIKGCKPTFLDQVWNTDHRFVSFYADPHWGETLPFPPDENGVREQVHIAIPSGLTDSYTLWHLGKCVIPGQSMDVSGVALRRFIEYLGGHPAS
jgi:hypothetical protein